MTNSGAVAGPSPSNGDPVTVHNAFGETEAFVVDLGKRVIYTAAEGALAAGVAVWGGSGLGVHDLVTLSGLEKVWSVVAVTVLAAFLAGARATISGFFAVQSNRDRAKLLAADDVAEIEAAIKRPKHSAPVPQRITSTGGGGSDLAALVTGSSVSARAIQEASTAPQPPVQAPPQGQEYLTDDDPQADQPIGAGAMQADAELPANTPKPAEKLMTPVYDASGNRIGDVPADAIKNGSAE